MDGNYNFRKLSVSIVVYILSFLKVKDAVNAFRTFNFFLERSREKGCDLLWRNICINSFGDVYYQNCELIEKFIELFRSDFKEKKYEIWASANAEKTKYFKIENCVVSSPWRILTKANHVESETLLPYSVTKLPIGTINRGSQEFTLSFNLLWCGKAHILFTRL